VPSKVLALFARAPVAGQAKTRLSPPLTPEEAAELYRAMLLDVLDQHSTLGEVELAVWYTPRSAFEWFRDSVPSVYRLMPQYGSDLGATARPFPKRGSGRRSRGSRPSRSSSVRISTAATT
jgi:hypothetical protein